MPTWEDVNNPPEPVTLDAAKCCVPTTSKGTPIDIFYDTTAHILTLGSPVELKASPTLGRLLILGLVTGTEAYFRAVLLGLTSICPLVRESISDQAIPFGAVDFYGVDNMALGLFEGTSFASTSEIKKRTKLLTQLTWADNSSLGVALANFEQVCHMRHAAVHSHGVLNRGNAKALGVPRSKSQLHVVIDLPNLHLAAKSCTSLVKAYNSFLFRETLQRWLSQNQLTGTWSSDRNLFKPLFDLFRSKIDQVSMRDAYQAYKSFEPNIRHRLARAART